jgi:hypothetical protein
MSVSAKSRMVSKPQHVLKRSPARPTRKTHTDSILTPSERLIMKRRIENSIALKRLPSSSSKAALHAPNIDTKFFLKSANEKLSFAINNSYAETTSTNHGYAVKRFLSFAAKCGLSESEALPCDPELLCLWIADGVGRTGVGTATANIAALSAWHRSHGLSFDIPPQMQTIKRALKLHWPEEKQRKPPRPPISPDMIRLLASSWSKGTPREKCALAIALAAFMGQMRLGELLPASANKFTKEQLPPRGNWSLRIESKGSSSIFLPWTKTTRKAGALVTLPMQAAPLDPTRAICHHLLASRLVDSALLCEFVEGGKVKVLDKEVFMAMCNGIWSLHGFQRITGHSFRIGGTTSLLLSGVDPEIVKGMGRWSSDAFKLYWRKVEVLFANHASDVSWIDFDI